MNAPGMHGFTLLETLLVMVLIGVLVGMVSLVAGPTPGREAREQADGVVRLIQAVRESAVLEGREYGLLFNVEGYRLLRLEAGGWQPVGAFQRSGGLAWWWRQGALGADATVPQITVWSSDEYSPFELHLQAQGKALLIVEGDGLNEPVWHEA